MAGLGGPPKFDDALRVNTAENWVVHDLGGIEFDILVVYLGNKEQEVLVYSRTMRRPIKVHASMPHQDLCNTEGTLTHLARYNETTTLGFSDATHATFMWLIMYANDVLDVARTESDRSSNDFNVIDVSPWAAELDSRDGMRDNAKQRLFISYKRDMLRKKMPLVRSKLLDMMEMVKQNHLEGGAVSVVKKAKADFEEMQDEEHALHGELVALREEEEAREEAVREAVAARCF